MRNRCIGMLLAGILSISAFFSEGLPASEVLAGQKMTAGGEDFLLSESTGGELWRPEQFLRGGMQELELVEISEEEAASLSVLGEEDSADTEEDGIISFVYGSQKYNSSWDVYSSNYIYNRLNQKEKTFWNRLDKVCRSYLTGTKTAVHSTASRDAYGMVFYHYDMEPGIPYANLGLSNKRAVEIMRLFTYANPQYYFLDSVVRYSSEVIYPTIYEEFARGSVRKARTAKMKKAIDKMEKKIAKGKTDLEKAKIAHDLIIQNVRYDHNYNTPYLGSLYHQSAYSVFCDGYTVCAGYSKAFELLLNGVGLDTIAVMGSGHAWNMVCLNDSWYQVDCTWDDLDGRYGREVMYRYFCRSTAMMNRLDPATHQMESYCKKYAPKCTLDSGATDTEIGTYKKPSVTVSKPKIKKKKVSGGIQITLKSATSGAQIYYTLDGKTPSPSFSRSRLYRKPFKVSSNVVVKAVAVRDKKWNSKISSAKVHGKICKVKFNTLGGSQVSTKKVYAYDVLKKPADPKRSGYRFAGWYRDKNYKTPWDFKQKVKKGMTLYARWKRK